MGSLWSSSMTMTRTDTTHDLPIQCLERYRLPSSVNAYCCLPDSQVWSVCVEVTGHTDLPMGTYSGEGQCTSKHHLSVRPAEHMVCYTSVQQCIGHL